MGEMTRWELVRLWVALMALRLRYAGHVVAELARGRRPEPFASWEKIKCSHPGCETGGDVTPCVSTLYKGWASSWDLVRWYGLAGIGMALHQARYGWVDCPPEYYCAEHAKSHGFCWGCGQFWGGVESFDFSRSIFCENCMDEEYDDEEDRDEWMAEWEVYPGDLLVGDVNYGREGEDEGEE